MVRYGTLDGEVRGKQKRKEKITSIRIPWQAVVA